MYYGFLLTFGLTVPPLMGVYLLWDSHQGGFLSYDFVFSEFHFYSFLYFHITVKQGLGRTLYLNGPVFMARKQNDC